MMLLKFIFAGLLLCVRSVTCGRLDEQLCADRVHKDCKCDIAHVPEKKSEWCHKLQSCGDCMAIPRCHSRYLDKYRSLLLTTMSMTHLASICPDIRYKKLLQSIKALRQKCSDGKEFTDRCANRCKCTQGLIVCYRVRKEFTQMSFPERRRYVSAFYKATTDPYYKDAFTQLLNSHSRMPNDYLHHMPQIFLPWHRWYLVKIENFLRQIDCRVTLPYFQWTAQAQAPFKTAHPRSVWSSGPQGIGGNGVPPDWCVQTGMFRKGKWVMPVSKGGGCLKRHFNFTCVLYNDDFLHDALKVNFTVFENIVREKLHGVFHICVGGVMAKMTAGNTPEFLLHHSFIDKIWDRFQSRSDGNKFAYYPSLNIRMPQADRYPWEYIDNDDLPGHVRVKYQEYEKP